MPQDVVSLTDAGLYCPAGDFYVDPWRGVDRAVITHGHGDHARYGSRAYHAARSSVPILEKRLGEDQTIIGHAFGESIELGDARVSFHPAGHVLGSAQVRIDVGGEVWVVSGDYKRAADSSCEPFELVACDAFITEATFALPIYRWPPVDAVVDELIAWWDGNARAARPSVLFAYALGKAQRLLCGIAQRTDRPVYVHGAIKPLVELYRAQGIAMPDCPLISEQARGKDYAGELILAPPSAFGSTWMHRFSAASTGFASGWMRVRGNRRRRGFDRGFVVSDHADWPDLLRTVRETGATRILATHGYSESFARFLREDAGLDAQPLQTLYEGESAD
ncbi:MAG: ligase-associated DNA damage response exonuclease [Geminicoccaceae bacterium]